MERLTFKTRLALWFSVTLALSLVGAGLISSLTFYYLGLSAMKKTMLAEASAVRQSHLVVSNQKIFFRKDAQEKTLSAYLRDEGLSSLVVDSSGGVVASYGVYRGLLDADPQAVLVDQNHLNSVRQTKTTQFYLYKLYGNRTYLEMISPLLNHSTIVGFLILSTDANLSTQITTFSLILLIFILPVALLFGWLITKWLVEKSFLPLEKILAHMSLVELGNLSQRIKVLGHPQDELVRLAGIFNDMLVRIEDGVQKQKEFVTNASHELKTPLAQAVLSLETAEMAIKERQFSQALSDIKKTKKDLKGFGDLIHSLLAVARLQHSPLASTVVDAETRRIITDFQNLAQKKGQTIDLQIETPAIFQVQKEHWQIILSNLLTNALKYGRSQDRIIIKVGVIKKLGYLSVENTGSLVRSAEIPQIIKRFYRSAKTKQEEGQGLGLSVVQDIVRHYRLKMRIHSRHRKYFRVYIHGFVLSNLG